MNGRPGVSCGNRLFEWTTALILLGMGAWLVVWPRAMIDGSLRYIYDLLGPNLLWVLLILVGAFRVVALYLNGSWPSWGPKIRALGSIAGAVIWLQMAAALVVNSNRENVSPPVGILIYAGLALAELKATRRARADANGL